MDSGYLPGYDLKVAYQRNMLYGLLLACLISTVGALITLLLNPPLGAQRAPATSTPVPVPGRNAGSTASAAGGSPLHGLNPYARMHRGFLGFRRLSAVPLYSTLPSINLPKPIAPEPDGPIVDSLGYLASGGEGYGQGGGEGDGWGTYVPISDEYFLPADLSMPVVTPDREIQVLTRIDPEYPRIALDRRLEGRIAVLVYVDAHGRLSTFPDWLQGEHRSLRYSVDGVEGTLDYAMTEGPADWFFGANFLKVLPRWQFIPRIENGEPVEAPLIIKYMYCVTTGCLKLELVPVPGQ